MSYWSTRVSNGLRKLVVGLRPFSESVWPGVRNDLFVAHESLYHFASQFVGGASVLDAGCGTGYGAHLLAEAEAASVTAVDIDRFSIRFARRRYRTPNLSFSWADCESLSLAPASLDVIYSSNVLEHLENPARFLSSAYQALTRKGVAILAVPPITTTAALDENRGIHYHRSNLTLNEWSGLLSQLPWAVTLRHHRFVGPGRFPDFTSPFPSQLNVSDFAVVPGTLEEAYRVCPITAVFMARRMAA